MSSWSGCTHPSPRCIRCRPDSPPPTVISGMKQPKLSITLQAQMDLFPGPLAFLYMNTYRDIPPIQIMLFMNGHARTIQFMLSEVGRRWWCWWGGGRGGVWGGGEGDGTLKIHEHMGHPGFTPARMLRFLSSNTRRGCAGWAHTHDFCPNSEVCVVQMSHDRSHRLACICLR